MVSGGGGGGVGPADQGVEVDGGVAAGGDGLLGGDAHEDRRGAVEVRGIALQRPKPVLSRLFREKGPAPPCGPLGWRCRRTLAARRGGVARSGSAWASVKKAGQDRFSGIAWCQAGVGVGSGQRIRVSRSMGVSPPAAMDCLAATPMRIDAAPSRCVASRCNGLNRSCPACFARKGPPPLAGPLDGDAGARLRRGVAAWRGRVQRGRRRMKATPRPQAASRPVPGSGTQWVPTHTEST